MDLGFQEANKGCCGTGKIEVSIYVPVFHQRHIPTPLNMYSGTVIIPQSRPLKSLPQLSWMTISTNSSEGNLSSLFLGQLLLEVFVLVISI